MIVGEGTRGGRERRREGESKGRERGSKDATYVTHVMLYDLVIVDINLFRSE